MVTVQDPHLIEKSLAQRALDYIASSTSPLPFGQVYELVEELRAIQPVPREDDAPE